MGCMKSLNFKYKVIDNFLTKEEVSLLTDYCLIFHKYNQKHFCEQTINMDTAKYSDTIFESLLKNKCNLLEKEINIKLFPTYSFWRLYTLGSDLKKHSDRASCEVSVTVMLGSDGTPYPIYMDGEAIELKPGQAIAYSGCILDHWREEFTGDWHAQVFLHYVDQEGPYANAKNDFRYNLGEPMELRNEALKEETEILNNKIKDDYKKRLVR
jgi:hypothetical protein